MTPFYFTWISGIGDRCAVFGCTSSKSVTLYTQTVICILIISQLIRVSDVKCYDNNLDSSWNDEKQHCVYGRGTFMHPTVARDEKVVRTLKFRFVRYAIQQSCKNKLLLSWLVWLLQFKMNAANNEKDRLMTLDSFWVWERGVSMAMTSPNVVEEVVVVQEECGDEYILPEYTMSTPSTNSTSERRSSLP